MPGSDLEAYDKASDNIINFFYSIKNEFSLKFVLWRRLFPLFYLPTLQF